MTATPITESDPCNRCGLASAHKPGCPAANPMTRQDAAKAKRAAAKDRAAVNRAAKARVQAEAMPLDLGDLAPTPRKFVAVGGQPDCTICGLPVSSGAASHRSCTEGTLL